MTTTMKFALAVGLVAALASIAPRQVQTPTGGAITTAQYCAPQEDDGATTQKVYCRHAG